MKGDAADKARNRDWHHKRKARGLCPRCAQPWAGTTFYCFACRLVIQAQRKARRARA